MEQTLQHSAPEMARFLDIEYELDLEVGEIILTVGKLLALKEGDVIGLDRLASQELLLTIERMPIAHVKVSSGERGATVLVNEIVRGEKRSVPDRWNIR